MKKPFFCCMLFAMVVTCQVLTFSLGAFASTGSGEGSTNNRASMFARDIGVLEADDD